MKRLKELIKLYFDFFKIGSITFGGGLSLVSVFYDEFVDKKKYLNEEEFIDIVAISESTPGPIAINTATFIGTKKYGILGGIIATLGVVSPSIIIISLISVFYEQFISLSIISKAFKGIMSAVVILIGSALFKLSNSLKNNGLLIINIILILITILLRLLFNINTIILILSGLVIGIIIYSLILSKKEVNK